MIFGKDRGCGVGINITEVVAEVPDAFMRYERALCANELDAIDRLFWDNPLTLRYCPNGTLQGHAAISSFRRARDIKGLERHLKNTVITTFGRDFAVANTETERPGSDRVYRQKPNLGAHATRLAHHLRPCLGRTSASAPGVAAGTVREQERSKRATP